MKLLRRNIRLVAAALCILLASLVAYGAYSVLSYGNRWFSSGANNYARSARSDATAGGILDRNGVALAISGPDGGRTYHPDGLVRSSVVHVVGDGANMVANGVENFMSSHLYAFNETWLEKIRRIASGEKRKGYDVTLTIDSGLSRRISELFPFGRSGAAVVMNYLTGEIVALQSFPGFDPAQVTAADEEHPLKPFWNRATQWVSAPGSTFKIVTLASALANIPGFAQKNYYCSGMLPVMDTVITDAGNAVHGSLSPREALALSCNITFAQIALELGDEKLRGTARSFGFGDHFLFSDIVVENSAYPETNRTEKEIAWTGAGQSAIGATPLHMCMVAASVANKGVMMEPRLLLSAKTADGEVKASFRPGAYRRALTEEQAQVIKDYMRGAVLGGTAGGAAVDGLAVCGKTGSAQIDGQEETNAWFIGFADDPRCPYAVCVAVENAGSGGTVAAPIAAGIFRRLAGGD